VDEVFPFPLSHSLQQDELSLYPLKRSPFFAVGVATVCRSSSHRWCFQFK